MLVWIEIGFPVVLHPYFKQGFTKALPYIALGYLLYVIYVILLLIHLRKYTKETISPPGSTPQKNVARVVIFLSIVAALHSGVMIYEKLNIKNLIKSECYRVPNTNPLCPGFNSYNTEPDFAENLL